MSTGLNVRGLVASYGKVEVVHGVDLAVGAGEVLGILGRNGAGKSTTILALAGFLGDVEGEITLDRTKPDGTPQKLLDVGRLNALGWSAKISLESGLAAAYGAYLDSVS